MFIQYTLGRFLAYSRKSKSLNFKEVQGFTSFSFLESGATSNRIS